MLPTRQSLRLRNKDPDGVTLPDLPIKHEPVDEHVSTKTIMEWSVTITVFKANRNKVDEWSAVPWYH